MYWLGADDDDEEENVVMMEEQIQPNAVLDVPVIASTNNPVAEIPMPHC